MRWVQNILKRFGKRLPTPLIYFMGAILITGATGILLNYFLWSYPEDLIVLWKLKIERASIDVFLASWWQDWSFFALSGLFTTLLYSTNPADEPFRARLGWLFAGRHTTLAAEDHLTNIIKTNSAFHKSAEADVYISSYDPAIDAYKITITIKSVFCNLLKIEDYEDLISVNMSGDEIAPPDGIAGEITTFEIARAKESGTRTASEQLYDKLPVRLYVQDKNYCSANGKIRVDADESVYYTCSFWHWSKVGVPISFGLHRFTEELTLRIHHDCADGQEEMEIPFSLDHPADDGFWNHDGFKRKILRFEQPAKIGKYKKVRPGERFRMVFSAPRRANRMMRFISRRNNPPAAFPLPNQRNIRTQIFTPP